MTLASIGLALSSGARGNKRLTRRYHLAIDIAQTSLRLLTAQQSGRLLLHRFPRCCLPPNHPISVLYQHKFSLVWTRPVPSSSTEFPRVAREQAAGIAQILAAHDLIPGLACSTSGPFFSLHCNRPESPPAAEATGLLLVAGSCLPGEPLSPIDLRGTSLLPPTTLGVPFQLGHQDRPPAPAFHVHGRISCIRGGRLTEAFESLGTQARWRHGQVPAAEESQRQALRHWDWTFRPLGRELLCNGRQAGEAILARQRLLACH